MSACSFSARISSRLRENSVYAYDTAEIVQNGANVTIAQDAQKGCPARPQQAKRRGVRLGTLRV
jgi:hypothetical protein